LLQLLDQLEASIVELDRAVAEQALVRPAARRLMTHPGVGPVTALAFTLTIGPAERFRRGKQIASYLGLIPSEYSSGGRQQAARTHQRTRQSVSAWPAGGSGAECGAA
jgi:transposase